MMGLKKIKGKKKVVIKVESKKSFVSVLRFVGNREMYQLKVTEVSCSYWSITLLFKGCKVSRTFSHILMEYIVKYFDFKSLFKGFRFDKM